VCVGYTFGIPWRIQADPVTPRLAVPATFLSLCRCALECLGSIFEQQGRMAGSAFPETVQVLVKLWKVQDYRSDIMMVLTKLLKGLGPSSSSAHKDIYKCMKSGLGDKSMAVRSASAKVGVIQCVAAHPCGEVCVCVCVCMSMSMSV